MATSFARRKTLPKKEAIYLSLMKQIEEGAFAVGDYLPSTRALATSFKTSITPVNTAIGQLQKAGYLEAIRGSGVRVSARSSGEAAVRRKPVVELISTLTKARLGTLPPGENRHSLPAVQEWLLWHLSRHENLRVRIAHVWHGEEEKQFASILDDLHVYRPNVFAFSFPEDVSDGQLAALESARRVGVAIIYRASRRDLPQFDRVYSDFQQGQRDLTNYLFARGHREIVRLSANRGLLYEQQKQAGFREAFAAAGFPASRAEECTVLCHLAEMNPTSRVDQVIGMLHKQFAARKITAIMAHNDRHVGVVRMALRWLNKPEIEVVGFDDDWDEQLTQTLADFGGEATLGGAPVSVDTRLPQVGEAMAELVLGRALGQLPEEPQSCLVFQSLIVPEGTAAPPSIPRTRAKNKAT